MAEKIKITINEREIETEKGARLIDVCRENGFGIPSFCYYQDLALQASCRMCLVRIDKMPKLQTSCTITCTDGMVVTTESEEVEKAQRAMGEFLLTNHPLDCPVCDRGGECELQEVIFDWGDVEERFTEKKNVAPEKYLSPIVANDPQRCILCKRCTRVCDEWMGEEAIEAGNRGVNTVIGTYGGWLGCSQCGNCIEVCPTGTLLDGVYRHETRPWELEQTVSTDVYSSDGMQLSIGSRGGQVHRIVARDRYVNGLNGEFLDIKARFGHGFIDDPGRIKTPMIRYSKGGRLIPASWDAAIEFAANGLKEAGGSIGVVASPRLTNESIFTLRKFAENVDQAGSFAISDPHDLAPIFDNLSVPLCTHKEIRNAATIVLIGGEPEEEQTFTAKQIRQAVRNGGARFICINERPINLAFQAGAQFIHVNKGSLDATVVALLDPVSNADAAKAMGVEVGELAAAQQVIADSKGDVIIMLGSDLGNNAAAAIAAGASGLAGAESRVLLHPLARYNNSVGANDVGSGRKLLDEVIRTSSSLLIAGSLQDPSVLAGKKFVVVQELFLTETADQADVVFPAASFAEVDGTFTNNAGNVQRVRKAIEPLHQSKPDWMITAMLARALGSEIVTDWSASAIFRSIADAVPAYAGLRYPAMKDESNPARANYAIGANGAGDTAASHVRAAMTSMNGGEKEMTRPKIGHKLHRVTTMTGKTPQFHLLASGNPKPQNLLVSPLAQFNLDGTIKEEELVEAVGVSDRSTPGTQGVKDASRRTAG
jgi:NADH-quinone oxidoreductase subunit G